MNVNFENVVVFLFVGVSLPSNVCGPIKEATHTTFETTIVLAIENVSGRG